MELRRGEGRVHEKEVQSEAEVQQREQRAAHPDEAAGGGAGAASEAPPVLRSDEPSMVCGSGEPLGICLPLVCASV